MLDESFFHSLTAMALNESPYPDPRFPPSPYYRFLRLLAASLQPNLCVELGVCGGGGSLHLALGAPKGRVVGVDIGIEYPNNLNYILSNYPNFTLHLGDSVASAGEIHERYGRVGLLFVDTTHVRQRTIDEYQAWLPYLDTPAVVCFDDLLRNEMGDFWEWLPNPKLRLDELHPSAEGGFGVWWKE